MSKRDESIGIAFFLSNLLLYGLFAVAVHHFSTVFESLLFGGLTMLVGSVPLLLVLAGRRKSKVGDVVRPALLPHLIPAGIMSGLAVLILFYGSRFSSGINTGLLLQVEPIYAFILGAVFFRERIYLGYIAATAVMLAGVYFVVSKGTFVFGAGELLILLTPLFYQLGHMLAKRAFTHVSDVNVVSASRLLYGGITAVLLALVFEPASLSLLGEHSFVYSFLFFGLIFWSLDFYLLHQALTRLPLSKMSALLPVAVLTSFVGSMLFLGERPELVQVLGLSLIVLGLFIFGYTHTKKPAHQR